MEVEFCGCANYRKVCQVCQEVNTLLEGCGQKEFERAFDAPVSQEAICASQRACKFHGYDVKSASACAKS